jgi:hypothetical protein
MGVADLAQRHVMPVSQYAKLLEEEGDTSATMTPDKAVRLLHKLAKESLAIAEAMQAACTDSAYLPELRRFVSDSKIYVLATQAMMHKEDAAILKARMLAGGAKAEHAAGFLREMEASVAVYQELAALADQSYLFANGLRRYRWSQQGIAEFKADLERQKKWLQGFTLKENTAPQLDTP